MLLRYKNMVLRKIRKLFLHYFQTILHLILVYTFGSQVDTIDCHLHSHFGIRLQYLVNQSR